jgi:hypothetical protein
LQVRNPELSVISNTKLRITVLALVYSICMDYRNTYAESDGQSIISSEKTNSLEKFSKFVDKITHIGNHLLGRFLPMAL